MISSPGDDLGSAQVIEYESHYFFSIHYRENEQFKGYFYHLDENGEVVDSLFLNGYYRLPVLYNEYIYLFNYKKTDSISIFKIDPNDLSVENESKVSPEFDFKVIHASSYFDHCNCFTLVGRAVDSNGYRKSAILQLDTQLNITKENYIRLLLGPFLDSSLVGNYGSIYEVMEKPEGNGLWLLGHPMDTVPNMQGGTPGITPMDSNLVRDSVNHKLLRSDVPVEGGSSNYTWGLMSEPFSGVRLKDTSYLFTGRALTDWYDEGIGWYKDEFDMGYVITDENLNDVRWEFWGVVDSTELSNTGRGISKYNKHVYISYTSNFQFFAGIAYPYSLMKLDLEGNELWTKHYSIPWSYRINSVLATSDGGAIMVGTMIDTNTIEKDIWVVKVDSLGNLNVTGINEVEGKIDASNYIIYPNPAKNQLNLLKVNQFKPYVFELYDTYGRLVKTVSWREDHQIIDISSIAGGIYVYRIIDQEGNVGSGKLIKE